VNIPTRRPADRRAVLALLGLGLLALAAVLALRWRAARLAPEPIRILLVTERPEAGATLSHNQMRAIATLLEDELSMARGVAVTPASHMPEHPESARRREPILVLRIEPLRADGGLGMGLRWAWNRGGNLGPWEARTLPPGPPGAIFKATLEHLPLRPPALEQGAFIPGTTASFWELVEIMGLRLDNQRIPEAIARGQRLVAAEPRCASAWLNLGNLLNRSLLDDPAASTTGEQAQAEAAFQKGLELVPDHPRGIFRMAIFRASSGAHREALDLLLAAHARHPGNPLLLLGIVNAARNAGLLDLATRAADAHEQLTLPEFQPQSLQLLHLYRQDYPRFEARLQGQPGQLRYSIVLFYRGYLPLLAGDRAAAREAFARCETIEHGIPNYLRLAKVFRLELEGRHLEASALLAELDRERVGLRVSDGEFTLRMAEAAAFLREPPLAVELAERSYTQGFGCTQWYERSPLLAPIRGTARYGSLLQHLRERQALMEARFPASRFGL
jgi:tetratricopeptide (TPR) repeat protein